MSPHNFVVFLLFSAFALALWADARWPGLAPRNLKVAAVHLVGAFVFARIAGWTLSMPSDSAAAKLSLLVALVLPALVYLLLACIWAIKIAQRMIEGYGGRGGGGGLRA